MNSIHYYHWHYAEHSLCQRRILAHRPLKQPPAVQNRRVVAKSRQPINLSSPRRALQLGFVPLTDCAPLVMARELGLFRKYGLRVTLRRELGWASIRDKIIYGQLDAAHAIAAMPLAASLGIGSVRCECLTALVLNLHGNAITLSNALWQRGVRDGATLRDEIRRSRRTLTLGVVYPFSSHRHLLRQWLSAHGIDPERDVHVVVVPPPQMVDNLKLGNLDGFCVGEPWNSVAVQAGAGWCAATSAELSPGHPEKVLMVRSDFAQKRGEEHLALVAALLEACAFCARPENHERLIATLARPEYINAASAALNPGVTGRFDPGHGPVRLVADFCRFNGRNTNEPSPDKAAWALELVRASGLCKETSALNMNLARRAFRSDLFEKAVRLRSSTAEEPNEIENENQLIQA